MLETVPQTQPVTSFSIVAVFAQLKSTKESYKVETRYKVNGLFCLRPISGEPYKFLELTAEQIKKNFSLRAHFAMVQQ